MPKLSFPHPSASSGHMVAVLAAVLVVGAARAAPGDYVQRPYDEGLKKSRLKVNQILRRGFGSGDQQLFDDYYRKHALAAWTLPENYTELPALRKKLRNDLTITRGRPVHDRLNNLALDFLGGMAKDDCHPSVRYNAMLMIGDLNVRPPARGESPVALPAAFPVLMEALQNKDQIDAVRVAAMLGIIRRARLGISDSDDRRQVTAAMLALATSQGVPKRSPTGHAWFRCRAIEVLELFKRAGDRGAVAKPLAEIVADSDAPLGVRCAAAAALGKLTYGNPSGLDPADVARHLGQLAADACNEEIEQCKKNDRRIDPRRLKSRLIRVRIALTGKKNRLAEDDLFTGGIARLATKQKDKEVVKEVWRPIEKWLSRLDNKELVPKEPKKKDEREDTRRDFGPEIGGGLLTPGMPGGTEAEDEQEKAAKAASDALIKTLIEDLEAYAKVLQPVP
jgi:hypothetical protein